MVGSPSAGQPSQPAGFGLVRSRGVDDRRSEVRAATVGADDAELEGGLGDWLTTLSTPRREIATI